MNSNNNSAMLNEDILDLFSEKLAEITDEEMIEFAVKTEIRNILSQLTACIEAFLFQKVDVKQLKMLFNLRPSDKELALMRAYSEFSAEYLEDELDDSLLDQEGGLARSIKAVFADVIIYCQSENIRYTNREETFRKYFSSRYDDPDYVLKTVKSLNQELSMGSTISLLFGLLSLHLLGQSDTYDFLNLFQFPDSSPVFEKKLAQLFDDEDMNICFRPLAGDIFATWLLEVEGKSFKEMKSHLQEVYDMNYYGLEDHIEGFIQKAMTEEDLTRLLEQHLYDSPEGFDEMMKLLGQLEDSELPEMDIDDDGDGKAGFLA